MSAITRAYVLAAIAPLVAPLLSAELYSGTSPYPRDPCARGLEFLYPFGPSSGDITGSACDDCANPVPWPRQPFTYFAVNYSTLQVGSNGEVSFGPNVVISYNPYALAASAAVVIAPFWVDVDMSSPIPPPDIQGYPQPNRLYMRAPATPSQADVNRLSSEAAAAFPGLSPAFMPTTVGVFTWFAVGRYRKRVDLLNTFQAVLGSDAQGRSFVTFCYDNLPWNQAENENGTSNYANAGFNPGLITGGYSLPGSFTAGDTQLSCGGVNGCYTFRVDGAAVVRPTPSASRTPSPSQRASPSASYRQQVITEGELAGLGHSFGDALSLSDDETSLVVGSPGRDNAAGAAYRFDCSSGLCVDRTPYSAAPGVLSDGDRFGGALAQDATGSTMAVGAPRAGGWGTVWVFACVRVVCGAPTALSRSGDSSRTSGDAYGRALALSLDGKRLAVGAPGADNEAGAVFIHASEGDGYGSSVAVSGLGTAVAVGAPGAAQGVGAAYLHACPGADCRAAGAPTALRLAPPFSSPRAAFGTAVSLSADGRTLAVGAPGCNGTVGAVFVYSCTITATTIACALSSVVYPSPLVPGSLFGAAVSFNSGGTILVVGSPGFALGSLPGLNDGSPTQSVTASVSPTRTQGSLSQTPSQGRTPSVTPSQSPSQAASQSDTPSQSVTPTMTITRTGTRSSTRTRTRTRTPSRTQTPTRSQTRTQTQTRSETPSVTATTSGSASQSASRSGTPSQTPSQSASSTGSASQTASRSPSQTRTSSHTRTQSRTPSRSPTRTPSQTATGTRTPTVTPTLTATQSRTVTQTPSPGTPPTGTPSPTVTVPVTPSISWSSTPLSGTPTPSLTPSKTPTQSGSASQSASPSSSQSPTQSATASRTRTPASTRSRTRTQTRTQTRTASATRSRSRSQTPSVTQSSSQSASTSPSASQSNTRSGTGSASPSQSASTSPSQTQTGTGARTPSRSGTATRSMTRSQTGTRSQSSSYSSSQTRSPSVTGTASQTPSGSRTPSVTPSMTPSQATTPSVTPTQSRTPSVTPSQSPTRSQSPSVTRSPSPTPSQSPSKTVTPTQSPSQGSTPSATPTGSPSSTQTPSVTQAPTGSGSGSPTLTQTPSQTPSQTRTPSQTGTQTGSQTQGPSGSGSGTRSPAATPSVTPSGTRSGTGSPSATPSQGASASDSSSPSGSATASVSGSPSQAGSASATGSPSPLSTPSASGSPSQAATPTPTSSVASSASPTRSPSITVTQSQSGTASASASLTATASSSPSASCTASMTPTPSPAPSGAGAGAIFVHECSSGVCETQWPVLPGSSSPNSSFGGSVGVGASGQILIGGAGGTNDSTGVVWGIVNPSLSPSVSTSLTSSISASPGPTPSRSLSQTRSRSHSRTQTRTNALSRSPSATASQSSSPSQSQSASIGSGLGGLNFGGNAPPEAPSFNILVVALATVFSVVAAACGAILFYVLVDRSLRNARERLARLKDAEETGTLAQMPGEYTGVAGAGGAAGAATSLDIREPSAAAMELDRIAEMAIAAADAAFRHVPVMGGSLQVQDEASDEGGSEGDDAEDVAVVDAFSSHDPERQVAIAMGGKEDDAAAAEHAAKAEAPLSLTPASHARRESRGRLAAEASTAGMNGAEPSAGDLSSPQHSVDSPPGTVTLPSSAGGDGGEKEEGGTGAAEGGFAAPMPLAGRRLSSDRGVAFGGPVRRVSISSTGARRSSAGGGADDADDGSSSALRPAALAVPGSAAVGSRRPSLAGGVTGVSLLAESGGSPGAQSRWALALGGRRPSGEDSADALRAPSAGLPQQHRRRSSASIAAAASFARLA